MPSYNDQSQPTYHPTVPVPAVYQPAPMQPYGHHLAQAPVVHPANSGGMDSVVVVPLPGGQQAAYYSTQVPYYMEPPRRPASRSSPRCSPGPSSWPSSSWAAASAATSSSWPSPNSSSRWPSWSESSSAGPS